MTDGRGMAGRYHGLFGTEIITVLYQIVIIFCDRVFRSKAMRMVKTMSGEVALGQSGIKEEDKGCADFRLFNLST